MTDDGRGDERLDDRIDPGEERVPIYSYPAKYRWIFTTCLTLGTLAVWGYRISLELGLDPRSPTKEMKDAILDALPVSGFTGILMGIIAVEVALVIGELLAIRRKRADREIRQLKRENAELQSKVSEADAKVSEVEAENADLRQKLERNDHTGNAER